MPGSLSWSDTLNRIIIPDTISYKLPEGVSLDRAPNQLIIDGFGTLPMQRTRVSVHNNELFHMVDDTVRHPLRATTTPAPAAPQAGPARQVLPPATAQAAGPLLGIGVGNPNRDISLFTAGQLFFFGVSMAAAVVGFLLIGGAHPLWAASLLICGTLGMFGVLASNAYHIPGPVPPAEAARAARAAEADLLDAMA